MKAHSCFLSEKNAAKLNSFNVQCPLISPTLLIFLYPYLTFLLPLGEIHSVIHICSYISHDPNYYYSLVHLGILMNSSYDKNKKISQYKILLKLHYIYKNVKADSLS